MVPLPQVTLVGRTSAWREHRRVDDGGLLQVCWLHHRTYGTIGVAATHATAFADVMRHRREWVQVIGVVQPCLAYALPDDPRSATSDAYTPLLVEATSVQRLVELPPLLEPPCLSPAQSVRIAPGRRMARGSIAPVIGWADAVVWHEVHRPSAIFAQWNTFQGVVTRVGPQRYGRYVLRHIFTKERERRYN